ncbi:NUDIX hydrolase [Bacillus weihaiensis]|uniref:ADP-ribose pyrophosphatase n=1 Tax=Bacillus weihaiensis TaxID=1547283 RepID=A0A1L3MN64_9BACI|nr:NUDIX hydrolase [Bacillus weihaiensis]APH03788.1 ADP-ribose pyrophosphatase [Bacillus weihaiensis]
MGYIMELREIVGNRPLIMTGACVILMNSHNEMLLQLRRDNNCWGFPGGSLEMGERVEETAKRELFEETGLLAKELLLFNVFSGQDLYYKYPNGDEVYNVVTAYICKNYEGTLRKEEKEVQELKFFNMADIPSPISPPDLPILNEYIKKCLF